MLKEKVIFRGKREICLFLVKIKIMFFGGVKGRFGYFVFKDFYF